MGATPGNMALFSHKAECKTKLSCDNSASLVASPVVTIEILDGFTSEALFYF